MTAAVKPEPSAAPARPSLATTVGQVDLGAILESTENRMALEPFLTGGRTLSQVEAAVELALRENPELLECRLWSLVAAVSKALQWGLEIGETVHLVPFNTKKKHKGKEYYVKLVKPIADYKGLAQLMKVSGAVRKLAYEPVFEGEYFVYEAGLIPKLEHRPFTDYDEKRKLKGAYVIAYLPFGHFEIKYMSVGEVDVIRKDKSKQWANGPCPPWYAVKTCIRQIAKCMPKDPRLAKVFRVVEEEERIEMDDVINATNALTDLAPKTAPKAEPTAVPAGVEPSTGEVVGDECEACGAISGHTPDCPLWEGP